jgi:hypothetical protein
MIKRGHIAGIAGGLALGGLIATWIGKTIMEAGIFVLTGFAAIGTGYLIGKLSFGKRHETR